MGWGLDRQGEVVRASQPRSLVEPNLVHTCSSEVPEAWLEKFNQGAAAAEMPYHQRPSHALLVWTEENRCSIVFGSPIHERVEAWFRSHSPAHAHEIGSLFKGVYFYDGHCWPLAIPIAYGSVHFDPFASLVGMPGTVIASLKRDRHVWVDYVSIWADCVDYGFGRDDVLATAQNGFPKQLFASGNQQLDATVSLLLEKVPNPKAMESARLALEMFLKSFVGFHRGIGEREAKLIGHDLDRGLKNCLLICPSSELVQIQPRFSRFPPMGARYEGKRYQRSELWFAYGTAQFAGSALVRSLTDRNVRKQVEDGLNRMHSAGGTAK
jgi:hypothetical protein